MATTTPNYGWTVPTSTDLVKDGATAIETLGDAIDASMNTALGTKKAGMVLLNTTSFSAVASQSFNDVFSTTYDNYKIVGALTGSVGLSLNFRFRVSGADSAAANYTYSFGRARSTDFVTTFSGAAQTSAKIGDINPATSAIMPMTFDVFQPFTSNYSSGLGFQQDNGNAAQNMGGWYFNASTSFTGFTLIASTGTITGSVSVYGYNK
jgi:hypothetical protein